MLHAPSARGAAAERLSAMRERVRQEHWQPSFDKHLCILMHFSPLQTRFLIAYGVFLEILKLRLQHLKGTYQETVYISKR